MTNGSFDEWSTTIPPQPVGWDAANVTQGSTLVHTPPHAAVLGANPTTDASLGQVVDRTRAGFGYRFEFHAQNTSTAAATAQVLFDETPVVTITVPPGLAPYSYYSAFTPCLPPDTVLSILFTKTGIGVMPIDDVSVSAVSPCVPS